MARDRQAKLNNRIKTHNGKVHSNKKRWTRNAKSIKRSNRRAPKDRNRDKFKVTRRSYMDGRRQRRARDKAGQQRRKRLEHQGGVSQWICKQAKLKVGVGCGARADGQTRQYAWASMAERRLMLCSISNLMLIGFTLHLKLIKFA